MAHGLEIAGGSSFPLTVTGQGLPLFMPKGTKIIQKMQRWIEDLEEY